MFEKQNLPMTDTFLHRHGQGFRFCCFQPQKVMTFGSAVKEQMAAVAFFRQ